MTASGEGDRGQKRTRPKHCPTKPNSRFQRPVAFFCWIRGLIHPPTPWGGGEPLGGGQNFIPVLRTEIEGKPRLQRGAHSDRPPHRGGGFGQDPPPTHLPPPLPQITKLKGKKNRSGSGAPFGRCSARWRGGGLQQGCAGSSGGWGMVYPLPTPAPRKGKTPSAPKSKL